MGKCLHHKFIVVIKPEHEMTRLVPARVSCCLLRTERRLATLDLSDLKARSVSLSLPSGVHRYPQLRVHLWMNLFLRVWQIFSFNLSLTNKSAKSVALLPHECYKPIYKYTQASITLVFTASFH